ncbi:hypothetical protein F5Y10DRAFT_30607 [Nemania abortiva]|nr:hypothetical protein F5Y10DRAFT_30607 [Nemania abortiva]
MLPYSLYSVYRQYKLDTDAIASWLATTAQANGYPQELLQPGGGDDPRNKKTQGPSRRLKGKARLQAVREHRQNQAADKARQAQKKYTIAVKDFVALAGFISEKRAKVGKVPTSFVKTLDRVIRARRAFGDKVADQGEATGDNSAHMYFVSVLEKVRDVMKPLFPSQASSQKQASADEETEDAFSNRFAGLSVYEPSEAFLNMPDIERPQPAKTAGDDELGATYEAERLNAFEDVIFALTTLMNDLNRLRERIKWIWTAYGQGIFDLCSAAIATNTAIDLARNLMDEITPDLDAQGGAWKMLQKFHMVQCMIEGHPPEALFNNEFDNHGSTDNFNYKLYDAGIGQFLQVYNMVDAFSRVIEPNQLPLYKEGMFGTYDPKSNRNAKSGYEKFHEDRALLMPFFTELMTVCVSVTDYPVEDEFLRGMAEMRKTRRTPFPMVFAAQVFLDIHHVLRKDVSRAFDTFQSGVTVLRDELEAHLDFHKTLKIDTWPKSNDQYMANIVSDIRTILRDPVYRAKERYYRRMNYAVPDSVEPNRILRMSPVLSGLVLFKYRAEVRDIAFTVVNAWGSVTYTAHLFNALSNEKLLSGDDDDDDTNARPLWPDMDVIRSLMLEDEQIFVGGAPSNADEYFTRFCLQMGMTVNAFIRRKENRKGPLASKAGPRGIKPETISPVTSMFIDRYVRKTGQVNWTTEHVERVIEASQWEAEGSEEDHTLTMGKLTKEELARKKAQENREGKKTGKNPAAKPARLTAEELIRSLTLALHTESPEFAFPLLTMHRSCWRLLRAVKQQCDGVLRELFTPAYLERETELPFVVGWIFMAAATFESLPDKRPMLEAAKAVRREVVRGDEGMAAIRRLRELGFPIEFAADEESFLSWKGERHASA